MLSLHIQLELVLKSIDILKTSGYSRDSRVKYKFIFHQALSSASPSPSPLVKLPIDVETSYQSNMRERNNQREN